MRRASLIEKIEQCLRTITMLLYTFDCMSLVLILSYASPILSLLNRVSGNYFSKNFRLKGPIEYVVKAHAYGSLKILGVHIVVENNDVK